MKIESELFYQILAETLKPDAQTSSELEQYVGVLDRADNPDDIADGWIASPALDADHPFPPARFCPKDNSTFEEKIGTAAKIISHEKTRREALNLTNLTFQIPSICKDIRTFEKELEGRENLTDEKYRAMRMRKILRETWAEIQSTSYTIGQEQFTQEVLEGNKVEPNSEEAQKIKTLIEEVSQLEMILAEQGLDGLIQRLRAMETPKREKLTHDIITHLPSRLRTIYDEHFPQRILVNTSFNSAQHSTLKGEFDRWKLRYNFLKETTFPEGPEKRSLREIYTYFVCSYESPIPPTVKEMWKRLRRSDIGRSLRSHIKEKWTSEKMDQFGSDPVRLAIIIEGITRYKKRNKTVSLITPSPDEATEQTITYHNAYNFSELRFTPRHNFTLTPEGKMLLTKALSAFHQVIDPNRALNKVENSNRPFFSTEPRCITIDNYWYRSQEWKILRIGTSDGAHASETFALLCHELAHIYHDNQIRLEINDGDKEKSEKFFTKLEWIYKEALDVDAALLVADFIYTDEPFVRGHPFDMKEEFFASATLIFTLFADSFVENIVRASTPNKVRKYGIKTWCFLRDEVFNGVVFTQDGKDPFQNYYLSESMELNTTQVEFQKGIIHHGLTKWIDPTAMEQKPTPTLPPQEKLDPQKDLGQYNPKDLTLIHFWGTWCNPCRHEIAEVIATAKELQQKGVRVIFAAEFEEDSDYAKEVFAENGGEGLELEISDGGNSRRDPLDLPNAVPITELLLDADQKIFQRIGELQPHDFALLKTIQKQK